VSVIEEVLVGDAVGRPMPEYKATFMGICLCSLRRVNRALGAARSLGVRNIIPVDYS
jgi:hypothetical protein